MVEGVFHLKTQGKDPATTDENIKRLKKACMAKSFKNEDTKAMTVLINKTFYKRRQILFDDKCTIEDFLETFPFQKDKDRIVAEFDHISGGNVGIRQKISNFLSEYAKSISNLVRAR